MAKYEQMLGFHKFLKERRANNEPMPESHDDLSRIYRMERPEFIMRKPNKWRRLSPKKSAQMNFRKHT